MKALNGLFFILNIALFAVFGYLFFFSPVVKSGHHWTPVELVTTVLSALAVLLTALGIFIAVLAVWGYTQIKETAKSAAVAAAVKVARETSDETAEMTTRKIVSRLVPLMLSEELTRFTGTTADEYGAEAGKDENDAASS